MNVDIELSFTIVRSQASTEADQPSTDCRTAVKGTRHSFPRPIPDLVLKYL